MKEIEQFTDHVGYGRRAPAWHTEFATHLHLPAKNGSVLQCENYIKTDMVWINPWKRI